MLLKYFFCLIFKILEKYSLFITTEVQKYFSRARLKNVDRSTATYHSVTVNDFTVVITEFKPKAKKEKPPKKEKGGGGGGSSSNGSPSGPADLNKSDSSNGGGGRLDDDQDTKRGKLHSTIT